MSLMKKQLAVISVLLTCAVCHAQNTLWGEVSFLEKADYFWSVSRFSDDHEIVGAAIDSASVYYSKAIESGTVREVLLPSVYLRLGYCHAMHGRFTESVRWNLLRLKNISEKYGEDSPEYAYSLLSIANVYSLAGDADRAEALMEAALSVYGKSGAGPFNGADTIARIDFLKTRINIKCERQKFRSAIRDAKEAVRLVGDYYGKSSQQYADEVLVLSALYGAMDYDPLAIKWASEAYDSYAVGVMKRFSTMSDDARRRYWNYASGYFHRIAKEGSPEIAYNSVLFSKGILLNTARAYTEFLYANADSTIMEDYRRMNGIIVSGKDDSVADSLDQVIMRKLAAKGAIFSPDKYDDLNVSWEDVRSCLEDDDLAIEFFSSDSGYYALLLKRRWNKPLLIDLPDNYYFNGTMDGKFRQILKENGITDGSIGRFKDIDSALTDKRAAVYIGKSIWCKRIRRHFPKTPEGRIFVSPDERLNFIGLEYLPFSDKMQDPESQIYCLSDIYPVYRLSSTRELVSEKRKHDSSVVAGLYGSPDFARPTAVVNRLASEAGGGNRRLADKVFENMLELNSGNKRYMAQVPYLPAAVREVHRIDSILAKTGVTVHIFTGRYASEPVFRIASGNENIIHLATHGYYRSLLEISEDSDPVSDSDLMSRSGLMMAGAIRSGRDGKDDGIMTSGEIASMDLRSADMVVLSACNTGSGYIADDGIYGLQRAFKMAGARSIIVSLRKIADEPAEFMMRTFYQNRYLLGMSKYDAFMGAVRAMRNTGKWSAPDYWTSFILIDPDIQ